MAIHKFKKLFTVTILLIIILINSGCPKPCNEASLSFNITCSMVPDKDSVHIGDTVFITSSFSTMLVDQLSGQTINYNYGTDIGSTLSIGQLIKSDSVPVGAVNKFKYYKIFGSLYTANTPNPETVQQLTIQRVNDLYQLKIGIIPQDTGVYALGVGDGLSSNGKNDCGKAAFSITFSNIAQHIYYYQNWRPDINLNAYGKSRLYCFKVY